MALVGNVLIGTGAAPGLSSIASAYAESAASSRIQWSALEYSGQTITAISGSAIGGQGGGVTPEEVSAIASSYASDKLDKTASSTFQPSGNYAYQSSLSSKLDASASSNFAPTGDYAYTSSLTGYLQNSASSTWYPMTGNPSNFLTAHQSLTGYTPKSAISAQSATWNTVSAKADASASHNYSGIDPVVVDNTAETISLNATSMHFDSTMTAYMSGDSGFVGVITSNFQPSGDYQTAGNYMSATESSAFYPMTGNPSGFLTTHQSLVVTSVGSGILSDINYINKINGNLISATTSMKATYAYESDFAIEAYSAQRYIFNNSSEPISALRVRISSKQDSLIFGYDEYNKISSIDGSALAGGASYTSPNGTIDIDNASGTMDIWNSSKRVDSTSIPAANLPGTASAIYSSTTTSRLWTGSLLSGDKVTVSATGLPDDAYPNTASVVAWNAESQSSVIWSGILYNRNYGMNSAVFTVGAEYTAMGMLLESYDWTPTYGLSGVINVERDEHIVVSTSLYEQVLKDSVWQSLTAWAVAQGWTP